MMIMMMLTKTGFMPDPYCESGLPKLTKLKRYLVQMMIILRMRIMIMIDIPMMVTFMMIEVIRMRIMIKVKNMTTIIFLMMVMD